MAGELIASLIPLIEAANATAGASAASNMLNDKAEISGDIYVPGKNTVNAVKELIGNKIDKHKMNTLLVDLVSGGLSSEDAKQIADSGYFTTDMFNKLDDNGVNALADYLGIPSKELRDKVADMSDDDIDESTGNKDPHKSPKDKAKAAAQASALKKARDKFKNWNEKEKEFANSTTKADRSNWGKTYNVPGEDAKAASRKLTNNSSRFKTRPMTDEELDKLWEGNHSAAREDAKANALRNSIKADQWLKENNGLPKAN